MSEAIDLINRARIAANRMTRLEQVTQNMRALLESGFDMAPNRQWREAAWQNAIEVIDYHAEEARQERDACMARLAVVMGQRS